MAPMKFWQLVSIFRDDPSLLEKCVEESAREYLNSFRDFKHHVDTQNRAILDAELPESLCLRALRLSKLRFQVTGGCLRSHNPDDSQARSLNAVEVYKLYGGSVIEETLEYGSTPIDNFHPSARQE